MAILEAIYARKASKEQPAQLPNDEQPRKRRRVAEISNRIQQRLTSLDPLTRLTSLQLLPFFLKHKKPSIEQVTELMAESSKHVTAKEGAVASWAMLACSR
jgi:serine-protein kinase ATM